MKIGISFLSKQIDNFFLVVWIIAASISFGNSLQASTPAIPDKIVQQALIERFLSGSENAPLRETTMTKKNIQIVVRNNLDPGLLIPVPEMTGTDFRFIQPGQRDEVHVAVLILSYPDEKTAYRMAKKLVNKGGYFRQTKILTRFSYVPVENQLVIAFTETAGDDEIVKFIDELAGLFKDNHENQR